MHEWALAESIIMSVMDEATKHSLKRVEKVNLQIGELQQLDLDVFILALDHFLQFHDLPLKTDGIVIETVRSVLQCRACGVEWSYTDGAEELKGEQKEAIHFLPEVVHTYLACPACGSPDFEILTGRGVWIESIEGEG